MIMRMNPRKLIYIFNKLYAFNLHHYNYYNYFINL